MVRHGPSWAGTVGIPMYYLWHDLFWAGVGATLAVARCR